MQCAIDDLTNIEAMGAQNSRKVFSFVSVNNLINVRLLVVLLSLQVVPYRQVVGRMYPRASIRSPLSKLAYRVGNKGGTGAP